MIDAGALELISPAIKWFTSAGFGMGAGWLAEWLKGRQDARDKEQELAILRLQLKYAEKTAPQQIAEQEIAGRYDLAMQEIAYAPTGFKIVDIANGLMRPVAAGACIVAFALFAGLLLLSMAHDLWIARIDYLTALSAFDSSTIADTIIVVWGFLFGSRSFKAGRS